MQMRIICDFDTAHSDYDRKLKQNTAYVHIAQLFNGVLYKQTVCFDQKLKAINTANAKRHRERGNGECLVPKWLLHRSTFEKFVRLNLDSKKQQRIVLKRCITSNTEKY